MSRCLRDVTKLQKIIKNVQFEGCTVGFVPTMGALHEGHLAIVRQSKKENDFTVVSVYVNSRQFNNEEDFRKYPRKEEQDIKALKNEGVDVIYFPKTRALFSQEFMPLKFSLGGLDKRLEGASRPGHFQGVIEVVHALFLHVMPTRAYFGQKDFQQVLIVQKMISKLKLKVELVQVPTVRARNGLALSSRNSRLTPEQKEEALILVRILRFLKEGYSKVPLSQLLTQAKAQMKETALVLDYLDIVDKTTLIPLTSKQPQAVACIAAFCGEVRLIDNMLLIAE